MTDHRPDLVRQPHRSLLTYYTLISLLLGPFFPLAFLPQYFRYRTLRYEFDGEGITMRWGILFRREISLTYARIQDIHLTSNILERRLGLGRIQIQTASGSAGAEMVIEGLRDFEAIRDDLYSKMRGVRGLRPSVPSGPRAVASVPDPRPMPFGSVGAPDELAGELASALREAAAELRRLRESLAGNAVSFGVEDVHD
jgi:putative membrane protein